MSYQKGELNEINCFNYLNENFKTEHISFERNGGMDSTVPDIAVLKDKEVLFYIEAKDTSAQAGQFVLIPDLKEEKFIFSERNISSQNTETEQIISYMNKYFKIFKDAGSSGIEIGLESSIFANWIIGHYQANGSKYIITHNGNDYIIFPVEKLKEYFTIGAVYRIKKSGSSAPAKRDIEKVEETIKDIYPNAEFIHESKKLYVELNDPLEDNSFQYNDNDYLLAFRDNNQPYEVRKLSNTKNANVIFNITLKQNQQRNDLEQFKNDLK